MNSFKVAVVLLYVVLLGGILWYGWEKHHGNEVENTLISTENEILIPTLEERINDWNEEKHDLELYNLTMDLPESIMRNILKRIGTNAKYDEIAEEYLRNTSYYISNQLKENMPEIVGPDAKNAKVKISTEVNRPIPEKDKPVSIPVIVTDSVK